MRKRAPTRHNWQAELIERLFEEKAIDICRDTTLTMSGISKCCRTYAWFDAAYTVALDARKIGELAEELDDSELRDLYGFMKATARRCRERFEGK